MIISRPYLSPFPRYAVTVLGPGQGYRPPSFAPVPPPVSWPHMIFATIRQISNFFAFLNCKKWANLGLSLNVQKPKVLQL